MNENKGKRASVKVIKNRIKKKKISYQKKTGRRIPRSNGILPKQPETKQQKGRIGGGYDARQIGQDR